MLIRTALAAAAALLVAAACGSSPSAPRVAGSSGRPAAAVSSPAAGTTAQRTHEWLAFAACMRAHGANLPDPSFDQQGNPQWSANPKTLPQAAIACQSHLQAVSAGKPEQAPTAAELTQLTRFAQCMRQHGFPDFPDPDPQTGGFSGVDKNSPALQAAAQACQQYRFKK